jgi:hypothetical protein
MQKVIITQSDLFPFLYYCVRWDIKATAVNWDYSLLTSKVLFIFELDKPITEEDFTHLKKRATSLDFYQK